MKGELPSKVKYQAMFGNNLSQLGVSATQLDNKFDTQSYMLQWLPTTGEFGSSGPSATTTIIRRSLPGSAYITRTAGRTNRASPGPDSIENSQIRLTDGNNIFTRNLFGPGINVDTVHYHMTSYRWRNQIQRHGAGRVSITGAG